MNWGLRNRLDRVLPGLPNGTGSVMFAIDHGYFMGPTSGLEDPRKTIVPLLPHADSIMLTRGILQNSIPKRTNIPIDPFYLTWKAKEVDMNTRFIELAGEINTAMPHYVIQKISESLNAVGKPIKNSRILVLGLAYKKNVDDLRESPSLELIDILIDKIRHHDLPLEPFKWYLDLRKYGSVPHSGFGLGLERTVAWICGTKHIRETIPFPRTMTRLEP